MHYGIISYRIKKKKKENIFKKITKYAVQR